MCHNQGSVDLRQKGFAMAVEIKDYEPEWRYMFQATSPSGPHVVVSGRGHDTSLELQGHSDDVFSPYDVQMIVGPWWGEGGVVSVVPLVTPLHYDQQNADEDDQQGWRISNLTWDAVSGTGAYVGEERIRLNFTAEIKGESGWMDSFGYYLMARGRTLGHEGLGSPGPVHPNP